MYSFALLCIVLIFVSSVIDNEDNDDLEWNDNNDDTDDDEIHTDGDDTTFWILFAFCLCLCLFICLRALH